MAESAAPAACRATAAFRSIDELAELCGHYCWAEGRIFELTGSRASRPGSGEPGAGDAEVRVALSEMSARHGFFAAQWRDRLPVRAGVDAGALIVAPPGPFGPALDLIEAEPDLARVLGGLTTQILPRLVERYGRHLAQASPVSEAPVRAVLEWAVLSTGRERELAGLLLHRLAPEGERARSVGDFGALVQGLLEGATDSFPGARAS
jgi:hypothetical protein